MMLHLRFQSSPKPVPLIALLNERKAYFFYRMTYSRMLRVPKRQLQQVINRYFIPASHPEIEPSKTPAYTKGFANNVPAIDFGQLCLEPLQTSTRPVNVGRNENIVALWVRLLQSFGALFNLIIN